MGTADDVQPINNPTSFVDQNQTYSSHSSHQVFLREYELNANGDPVATGKLIEGGNGGMATWADLKAQAADLLGIQLLGRRCRQYPAAGHRRIWQFPSRTQRLSADRHAGPQSGVTRRSCVEGDPAANGGLGVACRRRCQNRPCLPRRHRAQCRARWPRGNGDTEIGRQHPRRRRVSTTSCSMRTSWPATAARTRISG